MKRLLSLFALTCVLVIVGMTGATAQIATHVVISEVYGGGGNSGAPWNADYVELYNPTGSSVSLTGWSVQYASAAGTSWNVGALSGSIASHGLFLVKVSATGVNGSALPTPDVDLATIAMSASNGKMALVNTTTALTGSNPSGDASVIDFVGYGTTPTGYEGSGPTGIALTNTTSAERKAKNTSTADSMASGGGDELEGNGWDTQQNSADFVAGAPVPQNSSSPAEIPPVITNISPIIASVNRTLFIAEVSGTDSVKANISDLDGTVTGAKLHVRVNGGSIDSSFTMSILSGTLYAAVIPAGKHTVAGNLVEYFISATDDSSAYSTTEATTQGYFVGDAPISSIKAQVLANINGYGARVNGTLNVNTNTYSNGQGFIQNATGGLQIFKAGGLPALSAGRNAKVQGSILPFQGAYEMTDPNFGFVDTSLGTSVLTPVTITLPTTQTPDYVNEGKLVKIVGVTTDSTGNFTSPRSYTYKEGDLDTITVRVESNASANNLVGLPIFVTPIDAMGILSFSNSFQRLKPRQASDMGYAPGDGTGTAVVSPNFRFSGVAAVSETLAVTGDGVNTLEGYSVTIPATWTWDGTSRTVLSGGGASAVTGTGTGGDPYVITVTGAAVTNVTLGKVRVFNLTTPAALGLTTWTTKTRVSGGTLNNVTVQPTVNIVSGFDAIASGAWSNPATWSSGSVPTSGDNVTFTTLNVTVNIDIANAQCNSLTMTGSGTASNSGPLLKFDTTGTRQLTVNGSLSITGGSGGGGGDRGGRPKLSSNGNSSATLIVKRSITTTSSNSSTNGDAGLNMAEGTTKLTGATDDTLHSGAGFKLANLEVGDGVLAKTMRTAPTSNATMNIRSLTVKLGSTLYLGTASTSSTLTVGNISTSGAPMLSGGVTVETGASLLVQESSAGFVVNTMSIDGGGITNNGTINLLSGPGPDLALTGCVYNVKIGGNSAGTSGVNQTVGGSNAGTYAGVTVDSSHTLTLNQDMIIGTFYKLTIGNATLAESAGNTVIGKAEATRTVGSLPETFGGIGFEITAGGSGSTIVTRTTGAQVVTGTGSSIERYFDVSSSIGTDFIYRYDNSEIAGEDASTFQLYKSTNSGSSWTAQGGTPSPGSRTVTVSGVTTLGRWTVADAANPLGSFAVNVPVAAGWNMVSNPVVTANDSVLQIFPTSSFNYAFAFIPASGYQQDQTMETGTGYWEKFAAGTTQTISGAALTADTIPVFAGWNMIGALSSSVDTGSVVVSPSGIRASVYFGYSSGYVTATTLDPGKAYWVKASSAGSFILTAAPAPAERATGANPLDGFNSITVTDATGASQTLYLGNDLAGNFPVSFYEMPPLGPEGTFDTRFESGRMVEVSRDGKAARHAISVRSTAYPLTVSWNVAGEKLSLSDGVNPATVMSGNGQTIVRNPSATRLVVSTQGTEVPVVFSLQQNYPNPFNPATTIRFGIPSNSKVTLRVYNILGQQVAEVLNGVLESGYHEAIWEARTNAGSQVSSGVYFYKLEASSLTTGQIFSEVHKMVLMK